MSKAKSTSRLGRRALLAGTAGLIGVPGIARSQGRAGVALVIGNSKYQWEAALPNVKRDAPDIARAFEAIGLKTELVVDATRSAMEKSLENFKSASQGSNFSAFYFAGHGATWARKAYLVPVDADLSTPGAVERLIPTTLTGASNRGFHRLGVFDNCRNNPADGWRQLEAERQAAVLVGAQRVPNALVLFSTAPGRVALDGPPGQNSPFAAALLRQLQNSTIDVQSLTSKLRRDVLIATEGRQVVWDRNGYDQPFTLNGPSKPSGIAISSSVGWGSDPSRIIELTNAYKFVHEHNLSLPSGLVACRPSGNSANARMVGSFRFLNSTPLGKDPALLVVMSVDGQTAEIITSQKGIHNPKTGKMEAGSLWRFTTATVSGDRIDFVPRDQANQFTFKWSDANSGTISYTGGGGGGGGPSLGSVERFTRLDG